MNYYNEWDPQAAAWLRELISERLIPRGLVDERSITEVKAEDLEGFTQCHFFAGIGGWPLALQLAGVDHKKPLWTGSPPCQPFSAAGKQLGQFDPRHLAPVFLNLISQCRPAIIFGEQVAPAIAKSWMCDLQTHLEGEDYAVGFSVLPACSVGAPHKRDRLFFGAHQLANSMCEQFNRSRASRARRRTKPTNGNTDGGMAHTNSQQQRPVCFGGAGTNDVSGKRQQDSTAIAGLRVNSCMANPGNSTGQSGKPRTVERRLPKSTEENAALRTNPHHSCWSNADWLACRDGKFRPVESGTFPLANGIPARVGRLRGYGNAIVPEVAAEFVRAFLAASEDAVKG